MGRVHRWDIVTIGNISRNRYWGESDEKAYRPGICTCTLITGEGFRLLVDPSLTEADRMAAELDRRTGAKLEDVTAVFLTHAHGDHHFGLKHFPQAQWLAPPPVAEILNASGQYDRRIEPASERIFDSIDILPTPGHTLTHHSLRFDCDGLSVVIAADAAMTRDFWRDRRGYFNSVDFDLASQTIEKLAALADIVVPGHDNYFLVSATPFTERRGA
jgi:glyoxylase-like metal-dependent hydrolase (beta-lactamase superfamily II)